MLIALSAGSSLRSTGETLNRQEAELRETIGLIQPLLMSVAAANNGTFRFVLSGRDEFLKPYQEFRDRVGGQLVKLRARPHHDVRFRVRVDRLEGQVNELLRSSTSLREQAALPGLSVATPPDGLVQECAALGDAIEAELRALRDDEEQSLNAISAAQAELPQKGALLLWVSALLALAGPLLTIFLGRRTPINDAESLPCENDSKSLEQLHKELHAAADNAFESMMAVADLQDQTQVLQSVLRSMSDGVIVVRPDGSLLLANPAADGILGGRLKMHAGGWDHAYSTFAADGISPVAPADLPLAKAMRGEATNPAEYRFRCGEDGPSVWVVMAAAPLTGEAGERRGAVLICGDVSEQKRSQEQLRAAVETADNASRAKSEYLSRMSHELRTPLNAILGFAQLLEMSDLRTRDQDSVTHILKAGRHLLVLINEVLDISRIEAGRLSLSSEPVQLGELLDEVVVMIEPLLRPMQLKLTGLDSPEWSNYVVADRQRLKQVLLNVLSNAVKYNRPAGRVEITTEFRNGRRRVSVADTGRGIPADKLSRLFQPFERLGAEDSGVEGTGIGLALCKRLVEAMGGEIGAVSEFGSGSTFWVEFAEPAMGLEQPNTLGLLAAVQATSPERRPKVLCIEDNPSNLQLVEQILSHRPHVRLLTARDGGTGLDLAHEEKPGLILLDVHLGDTDGGEVLRQLKSSPMTADIPVTIVSADATVHQRERLLAAGAKNYLTKPLDIRKLLDEVDEVFPQECVSR